MLLTGYKPFREEAPQFCGKEVSSVAMGVALNEQGKNASFLVLHYSPDNDNKDEQLAKVELVSVDGHYALAPHETDSQAASWLKQNMLPEE